MFLKTEPNYYQMLGISRQATDEEIKSAYHAKALKLHPDRNPESDATEKMQILVEAYQTLSDQSKRAAYDKKSFPNISEFQFFHKRSEYSSECPPRSDSKKTSSPFFWHIKLLHTQYELLSYSYKHALMSICFLDGNWKIEAGLSFIPKKIELMEKEMRNTNFNNKHDLDEAFSEPQKTVNMMLVEIMNCIVQFKRATEEQGSEMREKFKSNSRACLNTINSEDDQSNHDANLAIMIEQWVGTFKEDLNKILTSNSEEINNHDQELKERIKQRKQKAAEAPVEASVFCSLM